MACLISSICILRSQLVSASSCSPSQAFYIKTPFCFAFAPKTHTGDHTIRPLIFPIIVLYLSTIHKSHLIRTICIVYLASFFHCYSIRLSNHHCSLLTRKKKGRTFHNCTYHLAFFFWRLLAIRKVVLPFRLFELSSFVQ